MCMHMYMHFTSFEMPATFAPAGAGAKQVADAEASKKAAATKRARK